MVACERQTKRALAGLSPGILKEMKAFTEERFVLVCCECERVRMGGSWVHIAEGALKGMQLTHGYCPECFSKALLALSAVTCSASLAGRAD